MENCFITLPMMLTNALLKYNIGKYAQSNQHIRVEQTLYMIVMLNMRKIWEILAYQNT